MAMLETLRLSSGAAHCLECGKCSTLCPLAQFGGFSAARMVALRDPEAAIDGQAEAVERCLTCGACESRCPQGVRFTDFVRGVRPEILPADRHPCPHGAVLQAAARLAADREAPARNGSWLGDGLRVAEEGETALFVGCLPLFDSLFTDELDIRPTEIARSAIRLLNRLDIEPVLVAEERCCGHDQLWDGDRETFERLAEANAAAFQKRGVKHILTTCAECYRTWSLDYAEAVPGYQPKVQHLAEFLAERVAAEELAFAGEEAPSVTFQDPCRLGRHMGVYDPPRQVLAAAGVELREMEHSGADAQCCGTSGFVHCDAASRRLQAERLRGAAATGAERLVTACPKCWIHFVCAQDEDHRRQRPSPGIEVEDLTMLTARLLASEAPEAGPDKEQRPGGDMA